MHRATCTRGPSAPGSRALAPGPSRAAAAGPRHGSLGAALAVALAVSAVSIGGAGCRVADARVANLREVHHPDGRPKRVGVVRNDLQYLLGTALGRLNVRAEQLRVGKEKEIEDPLGVCFQNVLGLADCDRDETRVLLLQAEMFGWLAVQDTYALTRERCLLELADVGRRLGVREPAPLRPVDGAEGELPPPAGPEEIAAVLSGLVRAARPLLGATAAADDPFAEVAAPDAAAEGEALSRACAAARDLPLDLDGARRLLDALIGLSGGDALERPALEPLRRLRDDVARRIVANAFAGGLDDPEPRVRAAALAGLVRLAGGVGATVLERGLHDPDPLVVRRTARLVRRFGLPPAGGAGSGEPAAAEAAARDEERWLRLLVERAQSLDGPVSVAACRALAAVTGRPESLRPETWLTWWEDTHSIPGPGPAEAPVDGSGDGSVNGSADVSGDAAGYGSERASAPASR